MNASLLSSRLRAACPAGPELVSARYVRERTTTLTVRKDVPQPPTVLDDAGVMLTVHEGGGIGYAATPDTSEAGIREAVERARAWAAATRGRVVFDPRTIGMAAESGRYASPVRRAWAEHTVGELLERLRLAGKGLALDPRIVEWSASLMTVDTDVAFVTLGGAEVDQSFRHTIPELEAYAHADGRTQRRSLGGGRGASQQGGSEVLEGLGFDGSAGRVARQAIELLEAPSCPTTTTELVLAPDQMMLQIHESIGHPLELDRILGDERNYAGTSFVTLDMFGSYQYGSPLLNVTFAPDVAGEFASYGFDDEGSPARREYLIRDGRLERPLGGTLSQARSGARGVANSRAASWNRAPIDRMANLNVEAGDLPFDQLIGGIERGVWMETNLSWSIDDSRNKFQFGCEYAREIVDGRLGRVLRDPNYRGISATFWRSLSGVGDASTVRVLGTPYCGKGEPNQVIRVGHASPACRFSGVEVFGGGE